MIKYIQTEGSSKGNIVELLRKDNRNALLFSIKHKFTYEVARTFFDKYYEEIKREPTPKKIKREPVKRRMKNE